jgi:hypothetical protein
MKTKISTLARILILAPMLLYHLSSLSRIEILITAGFEVARRLMLTL